MHFSVNFNISGGIQTKIISTESWSTCLAYCEGTGLYFKTITDISNALIAYNTPGTNCYSLSGLNQDGVNVNSYVWASNFDELSVWADSQNFQKVNSLQLLNISYVIV